MEFSSETPLDSNFEWMEKATSLLNDVRSSSCLNTNPIEPEVILSKLNSDDPDVLEVLLSLSHFALKEEQPLINSFYLQSDNELDLKRNLIKIILHPPEKEVLSVLFVSFANEETDYLRLRLVIKHLWPLLDPEVITTLHSLEVDKIIFILFTVWNTIDPLKLYEFSWFWESLCEGLSFSTDSGTVKRALYLLRSSKKEVLSVNNPQIWDEYLNLIETLDEKQVHIVSPSLSKLASFNKAFSEDRKWYLVIYRRLFKHQNLALVDWSLNRCLKNYSLEELGLSFFRKDLLPTLNISKLYHADRSIRESVFIFFDKCTSSSLDFIVKEVVSIKSWAPIPLFFVIQSIKKMVDKMPEYLLGLSTLNHVSEFCKDNMTCMLPTLQISIKTELLNIILGSRCEYSNVFSAIRSILKLFFKTDILLPKCKELMNRVGHWMRNIPLGSEHENASEWERVLFALLQDDSKKYIRNYTLLPLLETLNRPYAATTNNLETYILFLNYVDEPLEHVEEFYVLIRRRLDKISSAAGLLNELSICTEAFHKCLDLNSKKRFIVALFKDYFNVDENIKKYILITFVASFDEVILEVSQSIEEWMKLRFPDALVKDNDMAWIESGRLWGTLECNFLKYQWIILLRYNISTEKDIIQSALFSLDIGGKEVCLPLTNFFIRILDKTKNLDDFVLKINDNIVPKLKESIFYYQKNSVFKSLLENYIKLCLHPTLVHYLPSETSNHALSLLKDSETISVIAQSMSFILNSDSRPIPEEWSNFVAEMLVYGPIFRKDLLLAEEVCKMASSSLDRLEEDYPSIRTVGFRLAFQLRDKSQLMRTLLDCVLGGDAESRKRRHFDNSFMHLKRNRAAQGIVILMNELGHQDINYIFNSFIEEILNEDKTRQQQPSVRYLIEWILSRLLILNPKRTKLFEELHRAYQVAKRTRLTVIPSFLVIFTQVALNAPERKESILELLCPWLMGQHYTTRSCAQICFRRIHPKSEKWAIFGKCLEEVLDQGDGEKNKEKLMMDFYQNSFDALVNWNLRDILVEFPRLCGISQQDWLYDDFNFMKNTIPLSNETSSWSHHRGPPCYCAKCVPGYERNKLNINIKESDVLQDIQKKIVVPLSEGTEEEKREVAHPKLILVASLIDRPPNLGGLCRTSEIFGIGSLVLNCLKSVDEKEFQNLSVSSQNWVNLSEVRRKELPKWLKSMKDEEGYSLLGVEQTAQSFNLYDYKFPEKTILVLGNEKEGICPDVLRELDATIEIPQFGMIRSFNVHVTGALVLSEYVRQRRLK